MNGVDALPIHPLLSVTMRLYIPDIAGEIPVLVGLGRVLLNAEGPAQLYVYGTVPAVTDDVSEIVPDEQYFGVRLPAVTIGSGLTVTTTVPGVVDAQPLTVWITE
jgi:hypothetical protein